MAKKAGSGGSGGSANIKARGLRSVLVPVSPAVHTALTRAAALADPPEPVSVFAAKALEAAARAALEAAGLAWPVEVKEE